MIRHEVSPRQGHAGVPWNHAKLRRIHLQVQLECMQPKSSWSGVLLLWIPPGKDNFITQGLWAFWGPIRMSLLFIVQHRVFVFAACPDARLHTHRWKLWFDRLQRSRISSWKNPFWLKKPSRLCVGNAVSRKKSYVNRYCLIGNNVHVQWAFSIW